MSRTHKLAIETQVTLADITSGVELRPPRKVSSCAPGFTLQPSPPSTITPQGDSRSNMAKTNKNTRIEMESVLLVSIFKLSKRAPFASTDRHTNPWNPLTGTPRCPRRRGGKTADALTQAASRREGPKRRGPIWPGGFRGSGVPCGQGVPKK